MDVLIFCLVLLALTAFVARPLYERRRTDNADPALAEREARHRTIVRALSDLEVDRASGAVDESTYELVLRRPFGSQLSETPPLRVQGPPALFSTASFDLIIAGRALIVFDHKNKKP